MVVRWALSIAAMIRGGGACASNAALRKDRTTNENKNRPCFLPRLSNLVILISQIPLRCKSGTAVCENSRCTQRLEWISSTRSLPGTGRKMRFLASIALILRYVSVKLCIRQEKHYLLSFDYSCLKNN